VFKKGKWMHGADTYRQVTKEKLAAWNIKNCPRLQVEAAVSNCDFPTAFAGLCKFAKENDGRHAAVRAPSRGSHPQH